MSEKLISFVRDYYGKNGFIPLHEPIFMGKEKDFVSQAIDSSFVSSVGEYVNRFEKDVASYVGVSSAVATVNGTAALHVALEVAGVKPGDLVITQPLTFVATCNAISYCGAEPLFVDVDRDSLGLSATAMRGWLEENAIIDSDGICRNKLDNRAIRACLPMHTFGHPADLDGLVRVTRDWNVLLVEDAAEAVGSFYKGRHVGSFGELGIFSFNGNKIITTGGGGMVLTDVFRGERVKHLTTTAKKSHTFEYIHDEVGYNYRLPNLNAALGCAQLEQIEAFVKSKRALAAAYQDELSGSNFEFVKEPKECRSNYWLNAVICEDKFHRDSLLKATNQQGIMTRPIWALMHRLKMYKSCLRGDLSNARWLEERVVNLPSSVREVTC